MKLRKGARKRNHQPLSRPPLERMLRIHQSVQSGKYPNATTLAAELEVSTKSIQRDLDFMRDRLDLPIEYDALHRGYRYTGEVSSFPTLQITEGELFALLVAEKALQQYRGTSFEKPLLSAFKKMAASLPDAVSLHLADWNQTISFRMRAEPVLNLKQFDALARAVSRREQLRIDYRKPGRRQSETRVIDPWHLANINGEWFLFAFDHLRDDLRTFVPARIRKVESTGKRFARPKKFSLEKRLRDSFGVHSGTGDHRVIVRFNEWAADYIREKRWHDSQSLKELSDGRLELRLRLSNLVEVERWILSWGSNAQALEPPELVQSIRTHAEKILSQPAWSRCRPLSCDSDAQ